MQPKKKDSEALKMCHGGLSENYMNEGLLMKYNTCELHGVYHIIWGNEGKYEL